MATIKSSFLTFNRVVLSNGPRYSMTMDIELDNVISTYGSYRTFNISHYVLSSQTLVVQFWRGQRVTSGGVYKFRWEPVELQLKAFNYGSGFTWVGKTVYFEIDVNTPSTIQTEPGIYQNVDYTINNLTINGISRTPYPYPELSTSGYSQVLTSYFITEPNKVVMPDFNSGTGFTFPGSYNTGVIPGASNIDASFNTNYNSTIQVNGSSSLSANTSLLAASGRIKLGQSQLISDFATETEYLDTTYFDDVYAGGFLAATMILGPVVNLTDNFTNTATAVVAYSMQSAVEVSSEVTAVTGIIQPASATLNSEFTQTAQAGYLQSADVTIDADTTAEFSGGKLSGFAANLTSEFSEDINAGLLIDVGVQYANDWVRLEDDYVTPYYYLPINCESSLWAQALVVKQASGNIQAESTITGTGGYFHVMGQVLMSAMSYMEMQQFEFGTSAGVIISSTLANLNVEFDQNTITGLLFDVDSAIQSNFEQLAYGYRIVETIQENIFDSQFLVPDTYAEVVTGGQAWLFAETALDALAGYLHPATATFSAEFTVTPTPVRLISIDEYYIDLVLPETRRISVYLEPRILLTVAELREISVLEEPRTFAVREETKIIKPELGSPYLAGRRVRRHAL